jgi:ribose 1,5-bisphosphokinase PhnN
MTNGLAAEREELLASAHTAYSDALLTHAWRNTRALLRRRVSRELRAHLKQRIAEQQQEAAARGVKLSGWRAYPKREGALSFGVDHSANGLTIAVPKQQQQQPRKGSRVKPAPADGGELLSALEASLSHIM